MPAGVIAPVPRSTRKRWIPRPLPGGRSTWVGSTSRSGELKVPTYARSGPAAPLGCARSTSLTRGVVPTSTAEAFRNDRREPAGGIMVGTACLIEGWGRYVSPAATGADQVISIARLFGK